MSTLVAQFGPVSRGCRFQRCAARSRTPATLTATPRASQRCAPHAGPQLARTIPPQVHGGWWGLRAIATAGALPQRRATPPRDDSTRHTPVQGFMDRWHKLAGNFCWLMARKWSAAPPDPQAPAWHRRLPGGLRTALASSELLSLERLAPDVRSGVGGRRRAC
jgi:hypothetical protein